MLSPATPLLGDTTTDSVLILSPLLYPSPHYQPTYPNYTLPPAILSLPTYQTSSANVSSLSSDFTLVLVPTEPSPTLDGLDNSLCAVQAAAASTGQVADPSHMVVNATTSWMSVGGEEGFRTYWVVGDLLANTNYTAWLLDEYGGMSGPIWLSTKDSASESGTRS